VLLLSDPPQRKNEAYVVGLAFNLIRR